MSKDVLFIEDDRAYRETVIRMFRKRNYRFVNATSVTEAIEIIDSDPQIKVIILDLFLGPGSGTEVLDHIRPRSDNYRVIILTAHSTSLSAESAHHYDVFRYLSKSDNGAESLRFSIDQAFADLERQALDRKMRMLLDIQRGINEGYELTRTLDQICEAVRTTAGAYTCHIRVYDTRAGDYQLRGYAGDARLRSAFEPPRKKGELFSGRVVESGSAELFDDLQALPEFRQMRDPAMDSGGAYFETARAAYIVPIRTGLYGQSVDAALNVSSELANYFSEERRALISEFVDQAALAISKHWLHHRREELQSRYDALAWMLASISNGLELSDVTSLCEIVARRIAGIIGAEVVSVFLYDLEDGVLRKVVDLSGETITGLEEGYAPGQSLTGYVFTSAKSVLLPELTHTPISRAHDDTRFDHEGRHVSMRHIPSARVDHYLGVPIRIGGHVRGVLRAINKKSIYYDRATAMTDRQALLERGFVRDDLVVLEIAANHLGIAIQNSELLHDKNRQVEQTRTLSEVAHIINSETDIDELLKLTIGKAAEVMQADICLLFLLDGDRLVLKESFGIPRSLVERASYRIGEALTGTVAESQNPLLLPAAEVVNSKDDKIVLDFLRTKHGLSAEMFSLMIVPVVARHRVIGVMKVIKRTGVQSGQADSDLALFSTFADHVAVAIDNAQIYEHQNERLAIAERNAALSTMVAAVAHEINNTIGIIPVTVAAIRAELRDPNMHVVQMLSRLENVAEQATDFANGIAGFSSGRVRDKEPSELNEVITETIRELTPTLDRYDGRLELALSERPIVRGIYPAPFKQIIRNVVLNAFQALDGTRPGVVRISTAVGSHGMAEVSVEDNGIGIKPEHLRRIFDADFTTKPRGNGLGLWLARAQLQTLGGNIEVYGGAECGSRFVITLPDAERGATR